MIRVTCPKCEKKLGAEDGAAGTVIACPSCGHKFRVPAAAAETPAPVGSTNPARPPAAAKEGGAKSAPRPAVSSKKTGPLPAPASQKPGPLPAVKENGIKAGSPSAEPAKPAEAEEQGSLPYAVVKEPEPPKPKKRKRTDDDDDDDDDDGLQAQGVGYDKEYLRRLKKKKQKAKAAMWNTADLWLLVVGLIMVWVGMGVLIYFKREASLAALLVGAVLALAGWVWLLVVVFPESILWGVLCVLFSPLAGLIFAPLHQGRAVKPAFLCLGGTVIYWTGSLMLALHILSTVPLETHSPTSPGQPGGSQPAGSGPGQQPGGRK